MAKTLPEQDVLAAGEFGVLNGELTHIDNASGHYLPTGSSAQQVAEAAFQQLGFNTQGKYIPKEWVDGKWRPIE